MKVRVTKHTEITFFAWWCWWSNWIDISVIDYQAQPYIIQMSVSRRNGKRFKTIPMLGKHNTLATTCQLIGDLVDINFHARAECPPTVIKGDLKDLTERQSVESISGMHQEVLVDYNTSKT